MFDLTSSKLLILAVVALIVVGPRDFLPLLRTLGRYLGMVQRQAAEFRAQFEEAMRESELTELKKEVEDLGRDANRSLHDATSSIEQEMAKVNTDLDQSIADTRHQADAVTGSSPAGTLDPDAADDPGAIAAPHAEASQALAPVAPVPALPVPIAPVPAPVRMAEAVPSPETDMPPESDMQPETDRSRETAAAGGDISRSGA